MVNRVSPLDVLKEQRKRNVRTKLEEYAYGVEFSLNETLPPFTYYNRGAPSSLRIFRTSLIKRVTDYRPELGENHNLTFDISGSWSVLRETNTAFRVRTGVFINTPASDSLIDRNTEDFTSDAKAKAIAYQESYLITSGDGNPANVSFTVNPMVVNSVMIMSITFWNSDAVPPVVVTPNIHVSRKALTRDSAFTERLQYLVR